MSTPYTIRDSLLIMTIALMGGVITSADTLTKWAERMEFGVIRDESVRAADGIDALNTKLGLGGISGRLRAGFQSLQTYSFPSALTGRTTQWLTIVKVKNHNTIVPSDIEALSAKPIEPEPKTRPPIEPILHGSAISQIWGTFYEPFFKASVENRKPTGAALVKARQPTQRSSLPSLIASSNSNARQPTRRSSLPSLIAPSNSNARQVTQRSSLPSLIALSKSKAQPPVHPDFVTTARKTPQDVSPRLRAKQTILNTAPSLVELEHVKKPNVLIVGDSLMGGVGPRLKRLLRKEHGFPNPKLKWKASTGLSRPDYFDWPKTLNKLLSEKNYDVVVAIFGTNDTQPVSVNRKSYRYGTKSWFAHYRKRVVKVLNMMCKAQNRSVYWIGLPTMRSETFNEKIIKMNALYREELARSSCGKYIPMDKILSPDGQFSSYLRVGKRRKKVRAGDGIHLSFTGYDYVARRVIDTILAQTPTQFLQEQMDPVAAEHAL